MALHSKHLKKARGRAKAKPPRAKPRGTARRAGDAGRLFQGLVALQKRLRAANGCPWDREQTHESLRPFLIEEAYEVLDAMEKGDDAKKFAGELGDLLLQIVFHAELAREAGRFDIGDVIQAVHTKMVRRHPHVFGKVKAGTSAEVLKNWEQIKAEERAGESKAKNEELAQDSVIGGVPRGLPALLEAYQVTRRVANVGFDWENVDGVLEKLEEEISELREALRLPEKNRPQAKVEEELGDLLFVVVNVARFLGADPELALKRASAKFTRRFKWMENSARRRGKPFAQVPRDEMEKLWDQAKVNV